MERRGSDVGRRLVRVGVASLLAVTAALGASCDDDSTNPDDGLAAPLNDGPIAGGGGDPGSLCMPSSANGTATYSLDKLRNGDRDAVIDDVTVNDLDGLEVIGTNVVPLPDEQGLAGSPGYPPNPRLIKRAGFRWDQRAAVPGATIPAGGVYSLAVGVRLKDPSAGGKFANIRVTYRVGEDRYALETSTEFVVPAVGEKC